MRIATGCIGHETHTFSTTPTTLSGFESSPVAGGLVRGEDVTERFRNTGSITGGFIDGAREAGLELIPLLWAFATPAGRVTADAYRDLKGEFLARLSSGVPVDGVLLDLHGAMVVEGIDDGEGDLLAALRSQLGPEVPIISTLDLHANITQRMAATADVLIGFDTYPHVDMYERGLEATDLMARMLRGCRPLTHHLRLPMLAAPPRQCTLAPPMSEVIALAHEWEGQEGVLSVTVSGGFAYSDIEEAGFSVIAVTDRERDLAAQCTGQLGRAIWRRRGEFLPTLTPIQEAVDYALESGRGPVVLADTADNPGGGTPCDGTSILEKLVEQKVLRSVVAVIADPESAQQCHQAGVGALLTLPVGGKTDSLHGRTLLLSGRVERLSDGHFVNEGPMMRGVSVDMGATAVFRVDGVDIILTARRMQPIDTELLRSLSIEPETRLLIALKSSVHFRAAFEPLAERVFEVDAPGLLHPDLSRFQYRRLRRPCFPLDAMAENSLTDLGQPF